VEIRNKRKGKHKYGVCMEIGVSFVKEEVGPKHVQRADVAEDYCGYDFDP
jgi:hypothetical protein